MPSLRPYVNSFCFCERVLTERDGVASLIRVVDVIAVNELSPDLGPDQPIPVVAEMTIFISLKGAGYTGLCDVTLTGKRPSGKTLKSETMKADFPPGENQGVNILVKTHLQLPEEGIYWFELFLNGELATKTPLSVVLAQNQSGVPTTVDGSARSPSPTDSEQREG